MYIAKSDLRHELLRPSLRNFFRTFGFFVVKEFYDASTFEECNYEYQRLYEEHFLLEWHELMENPPSTQLFVPNFLDSSQLLLKNVVNNDLAEIVSYLLGDDYIYLGSDGSCFISSSFQWHRDWFTTIPQLKVNSYFNRKSYTGGNFLVIPGSHNVSDFYTNNIGEGLGWPFGNSKTSGLNEREFFPEIPSAREVFSAPTSLRGFNVPHQTIAIEERDIILFDQRLLHVVEEVKPVSPRMLCTALFTSNPSSVIDDIFYRDYFRSVSRYFDRKVDADYLRSELNTLFWAERDQIGCSAYGPFVLLNEHLSEKHLMCKENEISNWYTASSENLMTDVIDQIDETLHPTYSKQINSLDTSNVWYRPLNLGLSLLNTARSSRAGK